MEDGFDEKRVKLGLKRRECVQGVFRESCPDGPGGKRVLAQTWKYPPECTLRWEQDFPHRQTEVLPVPPGRSPSAFNTLHKAEGWVSAETTPVLMDVLGAQTQFCLCRAALVRSSRGLLLTLFFLSAPLVWGVCMVMMEVRKTFSWIKHFQWLLQWYTLILKLATLNYFEKEDILGREPWAVQRWGVPCCCPNVAVTT